MIEKEISEMLRLSPLEMTHFEILCDSVGMRQHATHGTPLLESGYTVDDNARALIAMLEFGDLFDKDYARPFCVRFLSFMQLMQMPSGWFRNVLGFNRDFSDRGGSADCVGRALWACARAANSWIDDNSRINSEKMFDRALPFVDEFEDSRPIAFSLLGLTEIAKASPEMPFLGERIEILGRKLVGLLELNSDSGWYWVDDIMTYANARIPHSLFACFQATGNNLFLDAAKKSFGFLVEHTVEDEMFVPVGQDGWFPKHGKKAVFDQQPIEAATMVEAATAGFFATGDDEYKKVALKCFNWFLGGNSLGAAVYDKQTGACFDGLTPEEVNLNQGAESLVEFILARFCMERMHKQKI